MRIAKSRHRNETTWFVAIRHPQVGSPKDPRALTDVTGVKQQVEVDNAAMWPSEVRDCMSEQSRSCKPRIGGILRRRAACLQVSIQIAGLTELGASTAVAQVISESTAG